MVAAVSVGQSVAPAAFAVAGLVELFVPAALSGAVMAEAASVRSV